MRQFKNKTMLTLSGFDEFLEDLEKAGASVDNEGRMCFEECAENLYDQLYTKAEQAGLAQNLLDEITETFDEEGAADRWSYEVGWKKQKPSKTNPLPDTYKVMFYNYGTPKRTTKKGYNRGAEPPHPKGSHGFIKKAKLAAVSKNRKIQKEALEKILGRLKKQ